MNETMDKDEILKALAHPKRLEMLGWMKEPEQHFSSQHHPLDMGICAKQFERCGLSQSTVSAHLAVLQRAGLVKTRRVGQWIFYTRDEETISGFLADIARAL